jgi:Bacterial membrane protein YfhO
VVVRGYAQGLGCSSESVQAPPLGPSHVVTAHGVVDPTPKLTPETRVSSRPPRRVSKLDVIGLLVSCLLVVVAFSPVLVGGRTLGAAGKAQLGTNGLSPFPGQPRTDIFRSRDFRPDLGASTWQFEPWAEVTHRAYVDGEVPLWNPYQAAGAPHAANMQSAVFDPLLLGVNLHPTPLAWDLSLIGAFVLGAAAAYLFGRVLGLRVVPAVISSAAFSLGGWFFLYSNNQFSRSYIFLPLLCLLVELALRTRRLWPVLGLGVAISGNIYVGMPEASFFVLGSAAVYAMVRLVQQRDEMPLRLSFARLGGGGLLGLLLASPLLLLFWQYQSRSFNIHTGDSGLGSQADPLWGMLNWIVPFFSAKPFLTSAAHTSVRNWFGVGVVIAALAAISGRVETKRLHAFVFLGLGAFLLVKTYNFYVLEWVGRLPVAKQVVFPVFASAVISFAFAMLAGIGVQVLWNGDLRLRRFLTLLAWSAALLFIFAPTVVHWSLLTHAGHWAAVVWVKAFCFAALAIAAVVLASRRNRNRLGAVLLGGVIVVELLVLAPFDIYARRADPFATPGWMGLVKTAQGSEPYSRVFAVDGRLFPDTAGALGLQDVRVLDGLYVERYWRYVKTFIEPTVYDRFTGGPPVDPGSARFQDNPMFDALGVKTVLSQNDLGSVRSLRLIGRDPLNTLVYRSTTAYPRAWVVHRVHVVEDEDDAFGFLKARGRREAGAVIVNEFDPRREAVIEHDGKTVDGTLRAMRDSRAACASDSRDRAGIVHYSAEALTLRVEAACPGLLVLPDTYFPGWKATVNGRDRRIYATDGAFRGVIVPEGTSRVEFRYEPPVFSIGVALVLFALAGVIGIGLGSWWRGRRRRLVTAYTNTRTT